MSVESSSAIAAERQLREACADLERRLRAGVVCQAEEYFASYPTLAAHADHALDLIYTEFVARTELGQTPPPEEYYRRFPQWRDALRQQFHFHDWMRDHVSAAGWQHSTPPLSSLPGSGAPVATEEWPRHYELLEEIGRGGMGVVYKARQVGLNRLVALKMILAGAHARPEELARFRAEAEAVARLQHPNIVQIHEVGQLDDRPFLALEYVDGGSLAKHCAGLPQPVAASARLIETLARAMHHAHQCGIIHRDLKPANILLQKENHGTHGRHEIKEAVEMQAERTASADAPGSSFPCLPCVPWFSPKITDFGLAKRLDVASGQTQSGALVGTPSYMAPEQAAGQARAVGPAADIYALGTILYEMLTGRPPFQAPSPLETLEQVRTQEPVSVRHMQPKVPRDLETICQKCLQKEPARRYDSAAELADDLRRFQENEPIHARSVGPAERAWRWCRRKPLLASLTAGLFVAVTGGLIGMTILYLIADANRDRAELHLREADENLEKAVQAVDKFHTQVSETRLLNLPHLEPLRRELLRTALGFYQEFVERSRQAPRAQANLGKALLRLATLERAIESRELAIAHTEEARVLFEMLTQADPDSVEHRNDLGRSYYHLAELHRDLSRRDQALAATEQALAVRHQLAVEQPQVAEHRYHLGQCFHHRGILALMVGQTKAAEAAYQEARRLFEGVVAEQPKNARYLESQATVQHSLAVLSQTIGRLSEAEQGYQRMAGIVERLIQDHPHVPTYQHFLASTYNNLGIIYRDTARPELALEVYQKALVLRERLNRDHPSVVQFKEFYAGTCVNLAVVCKDAGRLDDAVAMNRKALELLAELTREHPGTPGHRDQAASCHNNLGAAYEALGQLDEAETAFRQAVSVREELVKQFPDNLHYSAELGGSYGNVARHLWKFRDQAEASLEWSQRGIRLLEEVLRKEPRHNHAREHLFHGYWGLAATQTALRRHADALDNLDRTLLLPATKLTEQPRCEVRLDRCRALARLGRHEQALAEAEALSSPATLTGLLHYRHAEVYALAATAIRADERLPESLRSARAEEYAAKAVTLLDKAREAGQFKEEAERAWLKRDPDLDLLRPRRDYVDFARRVEEK